MLTLPGLLPKATSIILRITYAILQIVYPILAVLCKALEKGLPKSCGKQDACLFPKSVQFSLDLEKMAFHGQQLPHKDPGNGSLVSRGRKQMAEISWDWDSESGWVGLHFFAKVLHRALGTS